MTLEDLLNQAKTNGQQVTTSSTPASPATSPSTAPMTLQELLSQASASGKPVLNQQPTETLTPGQPLSPSKQIAANYQSGKINAPSAVIQDVGEAAQETNAALNSPWSPIGWVTDAIGGASKVLGAGLDAVDSYIAPKIGTALRNAVGAQTADKLGQDIVSAANSPVAQTIKKTVENPNVEGDLKAGVQIAQLAGTAAGTGAAAEGLGALSESAAPVADSLKATADAASAAKAPEQIPNVVGKITQATGGDIPVATRALSSIDTTGVKTFSDLTDRLDDQISENTSQVDKMLNKSRKTYTTADLEQKIPVQGGEPVTSNPTKDALNQLEDYYEKTNDTKSLARIKTLQTKLDSSGLTAKQINDLAREHGQELNGYNANGQLASGLSKQAAENTRQGVKAVVDNLAPEAGRKPIDANTSDLIKTKDMVDEMDQKVQQLQNRLKTYSPLQKLGRFAGKAIDMFSGGMVKGFLRSVMGIGGDNGTTMNALDLQNSLAKNLSLLDKLNAMTPEQTVQEIGKMLALPAPTPGATAASAVAPNTTPAVPNTSVETPIPMRGETTFESSVSPNSETGNTPQRSPDLVQLTPDQRIQAQQEVTQDALRFRSKTAYQNYVNNNPAIANKISVSGLTPESVWQNALKEFKKMGVANPLAKGKASFPIPE